MIKNYSINTLSDYFISSNFLNNISEYFGVLLPDTQNEAFIKALSCCYDEFPNTLKSPEEIFEIFREADKYFKETINNGLSNSKISYTDCSYIGMHYQNYTQHIELNQDDTEAISWFYIYRYTLIYICSIMVNHLIQSGLYMNYYSEINEYEILNKSI